MSGAGDAYAGDDGDDTDFGAGDGQGIAKVAHPIYAIKAVPVERSILFFMVVNNPPQDKIYLLRGAVCSQRPMLS
jgi:hypothetical protein